MPLLSLSYLLLPLSSNWKEKSGAASHSLGFWASAELLPTPAHRPRLASPLPRPPFPPPCPSFTAAFGTCFCHSKLLAGLLKKLNLSMKCIKHWNKGDGVLAFVCLCLWGFRVRHWGVGVYNSLASFAGSCIYWTTKTHTYKHRHERP